ncbi:Uncharacterized membrane protein [Seinonella peptonophila]|uniref:Uncharacterized membrane protein n=1 Tax=Seinonella peptonophila TaxID=112248 RepID=A0A1M4XIQ1_9BACL|nr:DUF2085 domain-containing protein [Seinonella peptonophila]SHE93271.1 Uncharacterized membrane protein [Seinonella peptonophila]
MLGSWALTYLKRMIDIVPCHRRPDRCFHVNGKPLPICARCMSMLLGFFFVPVLFILPFVIPWWIGVGAQVPMLIDGFTQKFGWRESTNGLRLFTGLISGFGLSVFVVFYSTWLVHLFAMK